MKKKIAVIAALAAATIAVLGVSAAQAVVDPGPPVVTSSPTEITVGEVSQITITNLDDDIDVTFGVTSEGGAVTPEEATVEDGQATGEFTADRAGDFTVQVRTEGGATVLGSVDVRVVERPAVTLTPTPARITVGQTSSLVATNLEPNTDYIFGVASPNAKVTPDRVTSDADGRATATFTSSVPGRYEVAVGADTAAATAIVEVVAASLPVTG